MKVFSACLLIIKRRSLAFIIYVWIFLALSIIMPLLSSEEYSTDFSELKPDFTIINRDLDSPLSDGLAEYLSGRGNPVELEDNKDALQDATFYRASDYIAILPQGFSEAFWSGNPVAIEVVTTPDSARGIYVDMLVNQYLNQVRMTAAMSGFITAEIKTDTTASVIAGMTANATAGMISDTTGATTADITGIMNTVGEETIVSTALSDLSSEVTVEVKRFGAGAPVDLVFHLYARFLCYTILVLIILSTGILTTSFRRPDLRMRNLCSPMKPQSMSGQQILCGVIFSFAAWLLLTAVGFTLYHSQLADVDARIIGLILLNSIVFTIVALSIASVIAPFLISPNSQNAASNFLALGLCFLGGVFVPLDLFGDGMLIVSRFTPAFWYVTALDRITALTYFSSATIAPVWQAILTQLIFAAAFFCVALVVSKQVAQSERFFKSMRTELES